MKYCQYILLLFSIFLTLRSFGDRMHLLYPQFCPIHLLHKHSSAHGERTTLAILTGDTSP